jgi:hypothetical protein
MHNPIPTGHLFSALRLANRFDHGSKRAAAPSYTQADFLSTFTNESFG